MAKADTANMDFFEKVGYVFGLWTPSWNAFKTNILTFVVLYILPLGAVMFSAFLLLIPLFINANDSTSISVFWSVVGFVVMLGFLFLMLLLVPAQIITQLESTKGKKISVGEALTKSKKYILSYIAAALLLMLIAGLPILLSFLLVFVIIGIVLLPFAFAWAVAVAFFTFLVPYIIVTENKSGYEAIKRSFEVTKKHWQWVLAIVIVEIVLSIVSSVPYLGFIISIITTIVYLCMPAIVYTQFIAKKAKAE